MPVRIRQQCQKSGPFYRARQLSLVVGFRSGDSTRYNFAGFSNVRLEQREILVINLFNSLGGEAAVLPSA